MKTTVRRLSMLGAFLILASCDAAPQGSPDALAEKRDQGQSGAVDPRVAHFFNTAAIANAQAQALQAAANGVATLPDGGVL